MLLTLLVAALGACGQRESPPPADPRSQAGRAAASRLATARTAMVDKQIAQRGVSDAALLDAMRTVPRHRFVPSDQVRYAYADRPLPIGYGQTISQPYIVALMTDLLDLRRGDKVLEVGTGSGYQAAILAELTDAVYSVEILPQLAKRARKALGDAGYPNVAVKNADGYFGWKEHADFDAIIVTAAPDHMPAPLVAQLKDGGRMVIPIGPPGSYQTLWRVTKRGGKASSENITDVVFVPLLRK